jgi:uncharacterized protein (TIGR03435 family)
VPAHGSRLTAWCALWCAVALGVRTLTQAQEVLRFEVASVKPHADDGSIRAGIEENEGFVRIGNLPLRVIIAIAHGVRSDAVIGPAWLDRRAFDISARPPEGYQRSQLPILLRNLLADRFMLVAHRERREGRGYALRIAATGHLLRESTGPRTFLTGRPGLIAGNGRSIGELSPLLAQMVGAPVVNETALGGVYDVKLEWTPQLAASAGPAIDLELSIFTAVREQLGLRLEPIQTNLDVVVVDNVEETPTPD